MKIQKITICLLIYILFPFLIQGCSDPIGNAVYVDELPVNFMNNGHVIWLWEDYGAHVYGGWQGFESLLVLDGMPITGVKVNIEVLNHCSTDDTSYPWEDFWEKYGDIKTVPSNGRTDDNGMVTGVIGYGPDGWLDAEDPYEGETIDPNDKYHLCYVSLRAFVKKPMGEFIDRLLLCQFGLAYSGVPGEGYWNLMFGGGGFSELDCAVSTSISTELLYNQDFLETPKTSKNIVDLPWTKTPISLQKNLPRTDPTTYRTDNTGWCILKYDYFWEEMAFVPISKLIARWIEDPNDPNEAIDLMTYCNPYVYVYDYNEVGIGDYNALTHTAVIKSIDVNGIEIDRIAIKLYVKELQQDSCRLVSDFIVPMEFAVDRGIYYDAWGNKYIGIQILKEGHLEISPIDNYGDFDIDYESDLEDFVLFSKQWGIDIFDSNYDFMFDENQDGIIDYEDFYMFIENYLGE
jgi:hypothetical protein